MSQRIKLGFMPFQNPHNRNSYSGALFFMMQALQNHPGFEFNLLGGYKPTKYPFLRRMFRVKPQEFKFDRAEFADLDVVVAPVASNILSIYAKEIEKPIILITDSTPSYLMEFYPNDVKVDKTDIEKVTFNHIDRVIYSSRYMADRAKEEFSELEEMPIQVAPYGVNLFDLPAVPVKKPSMDRLEMVFIAKAWQRKGGDIALATLDELLAREIDVHLTIIGDGTPEANAHKAVSVVGFLDKSHAKESVSYEEILSNAHVLISPTRADCTPMVIGEANSFACPVVITDVGGVSSLIKNGVNGQMMALEDGPKEWATTIESLTVGNENYNDISVASFQYSQLRLSWTSWAQSVFENATEAMQK
jgi:glycosyltransferase involved in cell wall biosynthesis